MSTQIAARFARYVDIFIWGLDATLRLDPAAFTHELAPSATEFMLKINILFAGQRKHCITQVYWYDSRYCKILVLRKMVGFFPRRCDFEVFGSHGRGDGEGGRAGPLLRSAVPFGRLCPSLGVRLFIDAPTRRLRQGAREYTIIVLLTIMVQARYFTVLLLSVANELLKRLCRHVLGECMHSSGSKKLWCTYYLKCCMAGKTLNIAVRISWTWALVQ